MSFTRGLGNVATYQITPRRYPIRRPRRLVMIATEKDEEQKSLRSEAGMRLLTVSYEMSSLTELVVRELAFPNNTRAWWRRISLYLIFKIRFLAQIQGAMLRPSYFWVALDRRLS